MRYAIEFDALRRQARGGLCSAATVFGVLAIACFSPTGRAIAAPGDLDSSFSGDGVAFGIKKLDGSFGDGSGALVAAQPDNSVVATNGFNQLVRYTAKGKRDLHFGDRGSIAFQYGRSTEITDLQSLADGKLLVAVSGGSSNYLIGLLPTGQIDTAFGAGGVVDLATAGSSVSDPFIAVGPSDEIAVVDGSDEIVRLRSDGQLKASFSSDGRVQAPAGQIFTSVAIEIDGSVLAAGHPSVVRYQSNGELDPAFPEIRLRDYCCQSASNNIPFAYDIGLAASDVAYVQAVGCTTSGPADCFGSLFKVLRDGTVDASFGHEGGINTGPGRQGLELDSDGRPLVASFGLFGDPYFGRLAIRRVLSSGFADPSFGSGGTAVTFPGGCGGYLSDIAIDSAGRIVTGGHACGRWVVERLEVGEGPSDADADGRFDPRDRCRLFNADRHRGCPAVTPRVRITQTGGRAVRGVVSSKRDLTCQLRAPVEVVRVSGRRSRTVARARTGRKGTGTFVVRGRFRSGKYYVKVNSHFGVRKRRLGGRSSFCAGDRSSTRRLK